MAGIALLLPVWIMWIKENQIRVELWWWIQSSKGEGNWPQAAFTAGCWGIQLGWDGEEYPGEGWWEYTGEGY